jgi:hypothetical protein
MKSGENNKTPLLGEDLRVDILSDTSSKTPFFTFKDFDTIRIDP